MKITELLELQQRLDENILENLCKREKKDIEHIELLDKRFTALFVELTEFLEADKREDKLEEYVDILHFLLSIINTLGLKMTMFEREFKKTYEDIEGKSSIDGMSLFKAIGSLANETKCFKYWSTKEKNRTTAGVQFLTIYTFITFLQLGKVHGFNAEEIMKNYIVKNEKNYNRQLTNY